MLKISKADRTLFHVYLMKFMTREEMIDYCVYMDNDEFFYYGAATQ